MTFPLIEQPFLATTTIVPKPSDDEDVFVQYLTRLYEDIAFAVNSKDFIFFTMSISAVAQDIPNVANFGAFFIAVSGVDSGQPTGTWALAKSDSGAVGIGLAGLTLQAGTVAPWVGVNLVITSTTSNFQIAHTGASPGNFNVRIITTQ